MSYLLICLCSFAASALTFYSGFGLGTLLTPVFALFFPVHIAVGMTAVVHLLNNVFKFFLVGRHTDREVFLKFGLPAAAAAFFGAWCLSFFAEAEPLFVYEAFGREAAVTPLKLALAALMAFFAVFELLPAYKTWAVDKKYLPFGGLLSGFFGGLSGHQGAVRSIFLIRAGLSKESFIGTGIAIAAVIDLARLSVYTARFAPAMNADFLKPLAAAALAAFAGAFLGNFFLRKMTIGAIQWVVSGLLLFIALLLASGLI